MSQQNVDVVRRIYDAFREKNVAELFGLFSANVEIRQSPELPWGGVYRGHDGVREFLQTLQKNVQSQVTMERFINAGDSVVAIGRTQGTVIATGKAFDVPIAHVWTIQSNQATQFRPYINHPDMLPALERTG